MKPENNNSEIEKDGFIRNLNEIKSVLQLGDLAGYAVKVKDYIAEAIYVLTTGILELEKPLFELEQRRDIDLFRKILLFLF